MEDFIRRVSAEVSGFFRDFKAPHYWPDRCVVCQAPFPAPVPSPPYADMCVECCEREQRRADVGMRR